VLGISNVICSSDGLDDVLERMMDDRSSTDCKLLTGHSGPVYAARFSKDRKYLVSCSEDGTGQFIFLLQSLKKCTSIFKYKKSA
jgi:transcription initiation factor TFIID subunit 5